MQFLPSWGQAFEETSDRIAAFDHSRDNVTRHTSL